MLNPYNEDFKCRAKDDMGECIDTPTAYQKARYPETETEAALEPAKSAQQELQDNRYELHRIGLSIVAFHYPPIYLRVCCNY